MFILKVLTEIRAWARKYGLISFLSPYRSRLLRVLGQSSYEHGLGEAMFSSIREGDVVWDVGANVGFYTHTFAQLTGPKGRVLVFEPTPICFASLVQKCSSMPHVECKNFALGKTETTAPMLLSENPLAPEHSLVALPQSVLGSELLHVRVASGDTLVWCENTPAPNVIKIDVEGFKEEVILGLDRVLEQPSCRAVFCEMHFNLLERKGERQAPVRIVTYLRKHGFNVKWLDSSHIAAHKREALQKPCN